MEDPTRSYFLVIEAVDLAGKSTQLMALAEALRRAGRSVATTAYPDRGAPLTGPLIERARYGHLPLVPGLTDGPLGVSAAKRQMLLTQMLFSLNRREVANGLDDLLARHEVVVSSRYSLSGLVYAQASGVEKADIEALLNGLESDLRRPDLTLVLDVDPDAVASRPRAEALDAFERDTALQRSVRQLYSDIARRDRSVVLVDGTGSPDEVAARLFAAVADALPDLMSLGSQ